MNPATSAMLGFRDREPLSRAASDVRPLRVIGQIGANRGASSTARESQTQAPVEVCTLNDLENEPERARERSKRLREAALLVHPTARRVLEFAPEHAPPFVALEWLDAPGLAGSP